MNGVLMGLWMFGIYLFPELRVRFVLIAYDTATFAPTLQLVDIAGRALTNPGDDSVSNSVLSPSPVVLFHISYAREAKILTLSSVYRCPRGGISFKEE